MADKQLEIANAFLCMEEGSKMDDIWNVEDRMRNELLCSLGLGQFADAVVGLVPLPPRPVAVRLPPSITRSTYLRFFKTWRPAA